MSDAGFLPVALAPPLMPLSGKRMALPGLSGCRPRRFAAGMGAMPLTHLTVGRFHHVSRPVIPVIPVAMFLTQLTELIENMFAPSLKERRGNE